MRYVIRSRSTGQYVTDNGYSASIEDARVENVKDGYVNGNGIIITPDSAIAIPGFDIIKVKIVCAD